MNWVIRCGVGDMIMIDGQGVPRCYSCNSAVGRTAAASGVLIGGKSPVLDFGGN